MSIRLSSMKKTKSIDVRKSLGTPACSLAVHLATNGQTSINETNESQVNKRKGLIVFKEEFEGIQNWLNSEFEQPTYVYLPPSLRYPVTIGSVRIKAKDRVKKHDALLSYRYQGSSSEYDEDGSEHLVAREYVEVFQSPIEGTIEAWFVEEGTVVMDKNFCILSIIEPCLHAVQYHGLCATCGRDVTQQDFTGFLDSTRATIQMSHDATKLTVSMEEATRLERETAERLLKETRLSLIVDLDQTILHATVDPIVGEWLSNPLSEYYSSVQDVQTFCLKEGNSDTGNWYYIKMRPGLEQFLENISKLYEMHIYTMGTRAYAASIARLIDKDKKYFGDRILSRDESGSTTQKNIQRLFPVDTSMVVIIDDRADVWQWCPNLIKVTPYEFFIGIGDINGDYLKSILNNFSSSVTSVQSSTLQTYSVDHQSAPYYSPQPSFIPSHNNIYQDVVINDLNIALDGNFSQTINEDIEMPISKNQDRLSIINGQEANQMVNETNGLEFSKKTNEKVFLCNNDTELYRLELSLKMVHKEFYKEYDRILKAKENHSDLDVNKLDIKIIMPMLKSNVLKGTNLLFSGIIPIGTDVLSSNIAQWAINFGAKISKNISNDVTHLIATKVKKALQQKKIKIVSIDWLLHSISHWKRLPESDYLLYSFSDNDIFSTQFQENFHSSDKGSRNLYDFVSSDDEDDNENHLQNISENINNENKIDVIDWEDAIREVDEFLAESEDNTSTSEDMSKNEILRHLFGGAITTEIPNDFIDASQFRQIPDHQEVLVNVNDERSLMVEILELAPVDDMDVTKFHFDILAEDNDSKENLILNSSYITLESEYKVYFLEGIQKVFKYNKQTIPKDLQSACVPHIPYIVVFLSVLRLHEKSTDIVITINIPFSEIQGLYPFLKDSQLLALESENVLNLSRLDLLKNILDIQETQFSTRKMFLNLLNTFRIHDWSLFQSS
ncbi:hypothetical protein PORY_001860 [Pneumocystis oryctolagi]|uniref:Uncharacterized protein n=1 Tax=Pneumocystis oryctolagi TaxID=42067 RepID=A0ACB7CCK6_9ASCO|nr:hypothetical protein PORY_001860 [Pneumocystis oryctolagi]